MSFCGSEHFLKRAGAPNSHIRESNDIMVEGDWCNDYDGRNFRGVLMSDADFGFTSEFAMESDYLSAQQDKDRVVMW